MYHFIRFIFISIGEFQLLYFHQHWIWSIFFDFSLLKSDIMVSHSDFKFSTDYHVHLIISLVNWLLKYFTSLFISNYFLLIESWELLTYFGNKPCIKMWFANVPSLSLAVFSFSLCCLKGKFWILMKSNLSILSFIDLCLTQVCKLFPMLPSRNFIGLGSTLRSMILLSKKIYVVRDSNQCSSFWMWIFSWPSTICWKHYCFLHWTAFLTLSKINWSYVYGSISGLSILLHWSVHVFLKPWYIL